MSNSATITIVSGPDRGRMFDIATDQIVIGHGEDNDINLSDRTVEPHQASIVHRNGRYAIYSPIDEAIEVDGRTIPAERWVWLPATARVRVSGRTVLQFNVGSRKPPGERTSHKKSKKPARAPRRTKRKTARFVTDQVGEPLVQLGDDGTLPELHLAEASSETPGESRSRASNPTLLYIVCGLSLLMSLAMLFIDPAPRRSRTADEIERARLDIRRFYGDAHDELEPYQRLLRRAQRAHSSRDHEAEREAYRRVLDLLNSEDNERGIRGLTGDLRRDEELRNLVGTLLAH